jgi:hypothetical protein
VAHGLAADFAVNLAIPGSCSGNLLPPRIILHWTYLSRSRKHVFAGEASVSQAQQ